jgi:hypothetical protein
MGLGRLRSAITIFAPAAVGAGMQFVAAGFPRQAFGRQQAYALPVQQEAVVRASVGPFKMPMIFFSLPGLITLILANGSDCAILADQSGVPHGGSGHSS